MIKPPQDWPMSIKIKDLKVGDKVKYKIPQDVCFSMSYPFEGEGIIMSFDGQEYVTLTNWHKFYKRYIVSKLEPIRHDNRELREKINTKLNQITSTISSYRAAELSSEILELTKEMYKIRYKEIPIEKESPLGTISRDTKQFEKSLEASCNYHKSVADCKQRFCGNDLPFGGFPIPETRMYCEKCKNFICGTPGLPIKTWSVCNKCAGESEANNLLNKIVKTPNGTGKVTCVWYDGDDCSGNYMNWLVALDGKHHNTNCFGIKAKDCVIEEPKSFKLEISPIKCFNLNYDRRRDFYPDYGSYSNLNLGGSLTIDFDSVKVLGDNCPIFENGKTYILEIKEKE